MRFGQTLCAAFALFIIALIWNGTLHYAVLAEENASIAPLRRTESTEFMALSLIQTWALALLFVYGYGRITRTGTVSEGVIYGLYFALLAGLLVDLNQFILYPIPGKIAMYWFLGGLIEFSIYGAVIPWLLRCSNSLFRGIDQWNHTKS